VENLAATLMDSEESDVFRGKKTAPSLALHHCLRMKLFQLAMGVNVLETDVYELNFLSFCISESERYFVKNCSFYLT